MLVFVIRFLAVTGTGAAFATGSRRFCCGVATALLLTAASSASDGGKATTVLTLAEAWERARATSPQLAAAREAAKAARGEERQAGAFPNPVVGYTREQTFQGDRSIEEDTALIEQPVEIGGQRGLRREAARGRRLAAEAALRVAEIELDFEVARSFALALAADERAKQANDAAEAFARAREASRQRRRAGDISGYEDRRLALEAARYAALRAHASMEQRVARLALAEWVEPPEQMPWLLEAELRAPPEASLPERSVEELRELALLRHPQLLRAEAEVAAADTLARLAGRGWVPTPVLGAGYKRQAEEIPGTFEGYIAQLSLPLPLWDRRQGDRDAAEARARGAQADLRGLRRRLVREVDAAWAGYHTATNRLDALRPHLGEAASAAVESARASYAEGEIRLVEWLDAVRAYQEAAAAFADVRADVRIQRAALERAVGAPLE